MRKLEDLVDTSDPAFPIIQDYVRNAKRHVEVLPPSANRGEILVQTQVTTRSPMGAVAYETGGILIDHGWLRILGSGHPRLTRTLPGWNEGRAAGFYLVADDAIGGFFAINGGALGSEIKSIHYWAPDSLAWENLDVGYGTLLEWALTSDEGGLPQFYDWIRWPGWEADVASLHCDRTFYFFPPLYTVEGKGGKGSRKDVPIEEIWGMQGGGSAPD